MSKIEQNYYGRWWRGVVWINYRQWRIEFMQNFTAFKIGISIHSFDSGDVALGFWGVDWSRSNYNFTDWNSVIINELPHFKS